MVMSEYSEHEPSAEVATSKRPSRSVLASVALVILSLIGLTLGITQQSSENNKIKAEEQAIVAADAAAAASAWIPSGYTVFSMNPDIAQDESANPSCASSSDSSGKYCWTYQIATKSDCSKVVATLDLTNNGIVIATVNGEVSDVTAESPTVLEVDSGTANDSVVTSSTKGKLTAIECK